MLDLFIIEEIRRREETPPYEQPRVDIPEYDPDWIPDPVSTGSSDRGIVIIETGWHP